MSVVKCMCFSTCVCVHECGDMYVFQYVRVCMSVVICICVSVCACVHECGDMYMCARVCA